MAEGLCVKEAGCGRSMSVALCGYDEDPVFFVDPCVSLCVCVHARVLECVSPPQNKATVPKPTSRMHQTLGRGAPASEGAPSCM